MCVYLNIFAILNPKNMVSEFCLSFVIILQYSAWLSIYFFPSVLLLTLGSNVFPFIFYKSTNIFQILKISSFWRNHMLPLTDLPLSLVSSIYVFWMFQTSRYIINLTQTFINSSSPHTLGTSHCFGAILCGPLQHSYTNLINEYWKEVSNHLKG